MTTAGLAAAPLSLLIFWLAGASVWIWLPLPWADSWSRAERIAVELTSGLVLVTLFYFVLALVGVNRGPLTLVSPVVVLLIAGLFYRRGWPAAPTAPTAPWPVGRVILAAALLLPFVYGYLSLGLHCLAVPVDSWDGLGHWLPRARYFAEATQVELAGSAAAQYPPVYSLIHSAAYGIGPVEDSTGLLTVWLLIGLLLMLGFFLLAGARRAAVYAAFCSLLIWLPGLRQNIQEAYADALLGLALLFGLAQLGRWAAGQRQKHLLSGAVFLALVALLKIEGIAYALAVLVLAVGLTPLLNRRQKNTATGRRTRLLPAFLIVLIPWLFWLILRLAAGVWGVQGEHFLASGPDFLTVLGRLPVILSYLGKLMITPGGSAFLFAFSALVVLVLRRAIFGGRLALPAIYLAVHLLLITAAYLVTSADLAWHLATSAGRLLLQAAPTALWFILAALTGGDEKSETNS